MLGGCVSAWPAKFVIGLTGNIATGKSVVCWMLAYLGADVIDADLLANRAIASGSPGYLPVLKAFGNEFLALDGQIDRLKLGRKVFSDQEALKQLEDIIHPLVMQAVDILVRRSSRDVIVIEAIKLLETGLVSACDSIWVTIALPEQQLSRLIQKRGMDEAQALQRMNAQSDQELKVVKADVVIRNMGSLDETWWQVRAAWERLVPSIE
jgi:dephospho-CoA kinase